MIKKYNSNVIFISTIICIFVLYSGFFKINNQTQFLSLNQNDDIQFLYGKLLSSPVKLSSNKYYSSIMKVNYSKSNKNIISSCKGNIQIFIPSDLVEVFFPGKLYSSVGKQNGYLWEEGGFYLIKGDMKNNIFFVKSCSYSDFENNIWGKISKKRALWRLQFKRMMYCWGNAGGLLLALICGAKEYTESDLSLSFRKAGLSHILALSGMHLSLFSNISLIIGKRIGRKKITFIFRLIFISLFVWFAGFSPSLLRAFICNILLLMASVSNVEKPDMLLILCFSFLIQIVISPLDIYNIGFILSYTALAGILIFNNLINKFYIKFLPVIISNSLSASTSAQFFTAPVSLKYFGCFYPIGIIATVLVSPLITLFIYAGLILIILTLVFPFLNNGSGFFMNFLYNIINVLVRIFSKTPFIQI